MIERVIFCLYNNMGVLMLKVQAIRETTNIYVDIGILWLY